MTTSGQRADTGTRPDTGAPAGEGTRAGEGGRADTDVRADGLARPGRQAVPGTAGRRWGRRRRGERLMVPKAEFRSYYGLPVLNKPTWQARDIAGYLFLGGLAGASSTLAAAATLTGRPRLARAGTTAAALALGGSLYALVHDLGRPARFLNMLRVFKPTSPMSMGSWLLAGYGGPVAVAAASTLTGRLPGLGRAATVGAGMLGAGVATYTGALIADTAVPLWHEGHRELPVLFAGSAAASAAGFAMVATPLAEAGPARRAGVLGAVVEIAATERMRRRLGPLAEPMHRGRGGALLRAGTALTGAGAAGAALVGRRHRLAAALSGAALLAGSACTRFGLFYAGVASAEDPRYTIEPQRRRLAGHA